MRIDLNRGWKFCFDKDDESFELVDIPHSVCLTPFNNFDEGIYQTISRYSMEMDFDADSKDKAIILHFAGVAHESRVYVNGIEVCSHDCGYTAFEADIRDAVWTDDKGHALIEVLVDSQESLNQPPFGNVIDYMTYGGIYREVWVEIKSKVYMKNIYHRLDVKDKSLKRIITSMDIEGLDIEKTEDKKSNSEKLSSEAGKATDYSYEFIIKDSEGSVVFDDFLSGKPLVVEGREGISFEYSLENLKLWDIDDPLLYTVEVKMYKEKELVDINQTTTGFRKVEWNKEGFFLNDKKIKLRGLNRHQSYPYVGYAMPESLQKEDARICRDELGLNVVRTSHYPQSQGFMEECDRIGLLVVTEIPGWQHIGDESWQKKAINNVKDMMCQYRNHPSIILWGVRINESQDNDAFYEETNRVAHAYAPSEYTGGVRFLTKSHLLEDVYTYNDFLHNGSNAGVSSKKNVTTDMNKGYLISEHNGHMYPTKAYDDEEHRLQQFLRHARVLNDANSQEGIAGAIGWCMFDYNTHKDFGSGDRICYHGVMDMFRNPKFAASLYESQQEGEVVLRVLSSMDIGEHPAGNLKECYLATNADSVKLYKNNTFIKEFYPDKENFKDLIHPPIKVDDFVGELLQQQEGYSKELSERIKKLLYYVRDYGQSNLPPKALLLAARLMAFDHMTFEKGTELFGKYIGGWGDKVKEYKFVAVKDGKEVMSVIKTPSTSIKLVAESSTSCLHEGITYDAAAIRLRAVDQNNNLLSWCNEAVELKAEGNIEIIGPKITTLMGGMGGTYIRSKGRGKGCLTLKFRDTQETIDYEIM